MMSGQPRDGELRHVVMFSGGVGSWATAQRVVSRHGAGRVTLLFADTLVEHPDLYRFLDEASLRLGTPITRVVDGRTPWQVFADVRRIGNSQIAPCSHLLKQVPCRKWMQENTDPAACVVYVGIDWSEAHRLPKVVSHWLPWRVEAPLCSPPYVDRHLILKEMESVGLKPPELYELGFPHNNCGGACVRGGHLQWLKLLHADPDRYKREEAEEDALRAKLGKSVSILRDRRGGVTNPLTLKQLRLQRESSEDLFADGEWGGCGCFTE